MKIRSLLAESQTDRVEGVFPTTTLEETARKLVHFRIGALVVTDENDRLKGIVSERDLIPVVANFEGLTTNAPVSRVMTESVITCSLDDDVEKILRLMNANAIRHIPVVDANKLIDMVSIRELTVAYEALRKEANTDPLTGLSNRRPFLKNLEVEYARAKRFKHALSVAMIDVDHFKNVNDTHGHDAGDQVLRAISAMLINEFRTIDHVGRLGGEEFAVLFPETDIASATIACNRLLKTIRSTIVPVDGAQIGVTASVGLAGVSPQTTDAAEILRRADQKLYCAKTEGRNQVRS